MKMKHRLLRPLDIAITAAVSAIAVILILSSSSSESISVEIITQGETVYETQLTKVREAFVYKTENGMEIEISRDGVRVLSSDCTGKSCISSGLLTSHGDCSICIPNKTVIRLTGSDESGPDAITY